MTNIFKLDENIEITYRMPNAVEYFDIISIIGTKTEKTKKGTTSGYKSISVMLSLAEPFIVSISNGKTWQDILNTRKYFGALSNLAVTLMKAEADEEEKKS